MRDTKLRDFHSDAYYDETDGVYRWFSNDHIPFDDMLESVGVSEEVRKRCAEVKDRETDAFLAEYLKREEEFWTSPEHAEARAERRAEMSAAFGEGVDVVNVITGRKHRI